MRIAICGSMIFSSDMLLLGEELRKRGHQPSFPEYTERFAKMDLRGGMPKEALENKIKHDLIRRDYERIMDSEAVLVLNKTKDGIENYIGGDTFSKIAFAHILRKHKYLMHPIPNMPYSGEIISMRPTVINGDLDKIIWRQDL